jgi:hypothetical protein
MGEEDGIATVDDLLQNIFQPDMLKIIQSFC